MTAVADTYITVSQFNVHVRDNLLETEAGRAVNPAWLWFADGPNQSSEHQIEDHVIEDSESTTSEEYTDLETYGPTVTLTCNNWILIFTNCRIANSGANASYASYEVASEEEGAFLDEAKASRALIRDGGAGTANRYGQVSSLKGLAGRGRYRVTMKYRTNSGTTGTFQQRRLQVMPL
jgi:hypothetical protein